MGTDGSNAVGGRQDGHPWVDAGRLLTNEIMVRQISNTNPFLAGQYAHAAQMTFNQLSNM